MNRSAPLVARPPRHPRRPARRGAGRRRQAQAAAARPARPAGRGSRSPSPPSSWSPRKGPGARPGPRHRRAEGVRALPGQGAQARDRPEGHRARARSTTRSTTSTSSPGSSDFWRALGERTQADLLLAGGLDFDIQDRTGYRTEEYISPFNGRTYYRQVLVEQTGFEYDILMQVYDGKTGELIYTDNFKDFQSLEGEDADPLRGMFENLLSLEDRIVGVFTQKEVEATRILFTQ